KTIADFVPESEMLSYLEAILRVYNEQGRRDNKYKARIKILVEDTGTEEFKRLVEEEYEAVRAGFIDVPAEEVARIRQFFAPPPLPVLSDEDAGLDALAAADF